MEEFGFLFTTSEYFPIWKAPAIEEKKELRKSGRIWE
jgi:hypothetical protein